MDHIVLLLQNGAVEQLIITIISAIVLEMESLLPIMVLLLSEVQEQFLLQHGLMWHFDMFIQKQRYISISMVLRVVQQHRQ